MTILNLGFGSCEEGCNENSSIELFMLKILKGREMKVHYLLERSYIKISPYLFAQRGKCFSEIISLPLQFHEILEK